MTIVDNKYAFSCRWTSQEPPLTFWGLSQKSYVNSSRISLQGKVATFEISSNRASNNLIYLSKHPKVMFVRTFGTQAVWHPNLFGPNMHLGLAVECCVDPSQTFKVSALPFEVPLRCHVRYQLFMPNFLDVAREYTYQEAWLPSSLLFSALYFRLKVIKQTIYFKFG